MVDPAARARLVALYALDGEWARAGALARTPLAGEIRLAWWREAVAAFAEGGPAEHPALEGLGREAAMRLLPDLLAVIEARIEALEAAGPSGSAERAVETAAIRLLDPGSDPARISSTAFPAIAHHAFDRVNAAGRQLGGLEKRLRITWAVLRGRT